MTIVGGTSTTADLNLQTTSGVGATGADMHFLVGNNGATEAMTILNSGNVGIGIASPNESLELSGNMRLPTTSSSVGQIKYGSNRFIHSYGTNNTFVGMEAGNFTLTGVNSLGIGKNTLKSLTSGTGNMAAGADSLTSLTTGDNNMAMGTSTLLSLTTGSHNVAVGTSALQSAVSGARNIALGYQSLFANTASDNIAIGHGALLLNSSGTRNIAIGFLSGYVNGTVYNNTGNDNIFIGYNSGSGTASQLTNAIAIGTNSSVSASNSLVLGNGVNVGVSVSTPTARLHLPAGTATASTAPIKLTSGTSLTSAEAGTVEFTTDDLFFTITTGTARKRLLMADPAGGLTSGRVPYATTNGRLTDASAWTFDGTSETLGAGHNLVLDTGTGTKIGTATSQKLSLWNATPIVQPTTAVAAATFVANTSGTLNDSATFDGYTLGQVVKALRNTGILA